MVFHFVIKKQKVIKGKEVASIDVLRVASLGFGMESSLINKRKYKKNKTSTMYNLSNQLL